MWLCKRTRACALRRQLNPPPHPNTQVCGWLAIVCAIAAVSGAALAKSSLRWSGMKTSSQNDKAIFVDAAGGKEDACCC